MVIFTLDLRHRPPRLSSAVGGLIDGFDYRTASPVALVLGVMRGACDLGPASGGLDAAIPG